MKRTAIIGGVALVCVIVFIAASAANREEATTEEKTSTKTTITSSTETTKQSSGDTSDSSAETESASRDSATYVEYDEESFAGDTKLLRILVFYDKQHKPSVALDTMLRTSLASLPEDVSIYKTTIAENPDIAESLGVTQPGAALSFDEQTQLSGVYISPETPSLEAFRAVLGVGEE